MNLALFPSDYYPARGGVQEITRQLAHENESRGGKSIVISNRWPKSLPRYDEYEGVPVRRYVFRVPERNFKQMTGALLVGPYTLHQVCADLKQHKTDIVNLHCVSSNAYYARAACRRLKLPLVLSLHGEISMDASKLYEWSTYARTIMRQLMQEATSITACSHYSLKEAEDYYGQPFGERGQVIYSGIRVADFLNVEPYRHSRPYIVAVGRLVKPKGFDVLLRALACLIRSEGFELDLLLAGDGEEEMPLKRLALELGVSDRLHMLGAVPREQAASLFAGSTMFILPSLREPMGTVLLEAMATGKPIVASRTGGVPELIQDGINGLLVEPGSIEELLRAMRRFLADPDFARRCGEGARRDVQKFDWSHSAEQFRQLYDKAKCHKHLNCPPAAEIPAAAI